MRPKPLLYLAAPNQVDGDIPLAGFAGIEVHWQFGVGEVVTDALAGVGYVGIKGESTGAALSDDMVGEVKYKRSLISVDAFRIE